jgi:tetratricopeptide (TPR) repeat protein
LLRGAINQAPKQAVTPEEVRSQLERILSGRVFVSSARMNRFLRFIVEESLSGRGDELKETTIGVAVFDRAPDYDPRIDPIVRVEARRLREKLEQYYATDGRENPVAIALPRGGYAPQIAERGAAAGPDSTGTPERLESAVPASGRLNSASWRLIVALTAMMGIITLIASGVAALVRPKAGTMRERDSIVLGDLENRSGEPAFELTLRQALAVQLSQSPFLSIVPDERVRETLRVMGREPYSPINHDTALEVCRRQSVKAMLTGSIVQLGRLYVLSLDATACQTGEAIAREQAQVETKEQVLKAVGGMASKIRSALGESLNSIQRFDAPIEQTTTPSLEALRAFALGQRQRAMGNETQSVAFFTQAIDLDPNFASAYNTLSNIYSNLGEAERAREFARLAYERRDRVSERERLYITYQYHDVVTGDQLKVIQTLDVWKQSFPREFSPANSLAFAYNSLGSFERAAQEAQEAIRRNPAHGFPYSNLTVAYRGMGLFEEARKTAERAAVLNVDTVPTRVLLYYFAVEAGDRDAAARYLNKIRNSARESDAFRAQALVAGWAGKVREARQFTDEAVRLAERLELKEAASTILAREAWMEFAYGNIDRARSQARRVLARRPGYGPQFIAGLTLAASGSVAEAESTVAELAKGHPDDTHIKSILLPMVKAGIELGRKRPGPGVESLAVTAPYETGMVALLVPIYLRGNLYLMQGSGLKAAQEFQRILDHRGTDPFSPLHAVAWLGLARAQAIAGDKAGSLQAYEQFLKAWAAADPDVPVLLEAREEYDRLRRVGS